MKHIIGIDPGASGHICMVDVSGRIVDVIRLNKCTDKDAWDELSEFIGSADEVVVYIEDVHSMPSQGVASTFKFGRGFGFLAGLIVASGVPYHYVRPQAWQKALGIKAKSGKEGNRAMAQQLWPDIKWAKTDSAEMGFYDAALIAEYGRRQ